MTRAEALEQIVTFGVNQAMAYSELVKFGYETTFEKFVVSKPILENVLFMFLADNITADALEEWANFIECRDDINYDTIEGYIYALANPYVDDDINKEKIARMTELLKTT